MPPAALLALTAVSVAGSLATSIAGAMRKPKLPSSTGAKDAAKLREARKQALAGRFGLEDTQQNPLGVGEPLLGKSSLFGQ